MNKLKLTKIETQFAEDGHTYTMGGRLLPGVTSILGIMDKPALKQWAANRAVEEIALRWKAGNPSSAEQIENALSEAKKAWRKTSKEAKDAGSEAHDWIEQHIKAGVGRGGELVLPKNPESLNSVKAFLKWEVEMKPEWLLSEEVMGSAEHFFAGTIDAVARIDGKLTVIDFKTSKGIYDEYWLQTAAYWILLDENLDEGEERPTHRVIVRIPKDGKDVEVVVKENGLEFEIDTFLHLREVARWYNQTNNKK